jgi:hypothetical protein
MLITTNLAACRLGVAHEQLLGWIARKLLPIAGEDEEGRVLLREHVVAERGEVLTAEAPELLRSPRLRQLWADPTRPRVLPCGCAFSSDADANPDAEPLIRCVDARALEATARLAHALAAAAPGDAFFSRLAEVTRAALARHHPDMAAEPSSDSVGASHSINIRVSHPTRTAAVTAACSAEGPLVLDLRQQRAPRVQKHRVRPRE